MRTKQMPTNKLQPHDLNVQIYGNGQLPADFLASVHENGILVPLAVLADGTIISGHRRWQAAQECGLATVPVHVVTFPDDLSERQALLDYNRQRDKTFSQKMAEAAELEKIEKEWARQRQQAGLKKGKEAPVVQTFAERGNTRDVVAQQTGIGSGETYRKARIIYDAANKGNETALRELEKLDQGKATVHAAFQRVEMAVERTERQTRHKRILKTLPPANDRYQVICGDIGEVYKSLDQVDAIVTDPPYSREFIPLYGTLAKVAVEILRPGCSMLVMTGQAWLPEVLKEMTKVRGLTYNWTLAYLVEGNRNTQVYSRRVGIHWKPILWFVKGKYAGDMKWDTIRNPPDGGGKDYHDHGQSERGISELVRRFSEPGDTVLDPFCGGGTTGVACLALGRRFVGVDVDETAVEMTRGRIAEFLQESSHSTLI